MTWTHDKQTKAIYDELVEDYGDSALAVACGKLQRASDRVAFLEGKLDYLHRKIAHGCTDASCEECDGPQDDGDGSELWSQ